MHNHHPRFQLDHNSESNTSCSNIPLPSFETICTISPVRMDSSFERSLLKSYSTLAVGVAGFFEAGGAEGGGGGGARTEPAESVRVCAAAAAAATGWGTIRDCAAGWGTAAGCGVACGKGCAAGAGLRAAADSFDGPPPGPPGLSSLPLVTGRAATCLGRGVGFETELGGSPALVWMVLLL